MKRLMTAAHMDALADAEAMAEDRALMGEKKPWQKRGAYRRRRKGEAIMWTLEPMFARSCEVLGVEEDAVRKRVWGLITSGGEK